MTKIMGIMKTKRAKSRYDRGAQLLAALIIVLLSWPKAFAVPVFTPSDAIITHMHDSYLGHIQHSDMTDCDTMLPTALGDHSGECCKACDDLCASQITAFLSTASSIGDFPKEPRTKRIYPLLRSSGGFIEKRPPRHV